MFGVILIVCIAILASLTTFTSSAGKIIDKRRKGLNYITRYGWFTISFNLTIILLSIVQFVFNESELKKNQIASNIKQVKRDSISKSYYDSSLLVIKSKFDTSNLNTLSVVSETLGKYGYLLDSSNKTLVRIIRDSSKTKIIISEDPVLEVCVPNGISEVQHENAKYLYKLSLCCDFASSNSINLKYFILSADSLLTDKITYSGKDDLVAPNSSLSKNNILDAYFEFDENIPNAIIYIMINGNYRNFDNSKIFQINTIYYFNPITKRVGKVKGRTELNIRNYLRTNKIL